MRKTKKSLIFVCCLLAIYLLFVNTTVLVHATEEDAHEVDYNSVIEVESYEIEEGYIEAGKEATITVNLRNSNSDFAANSLVVVASSSSGMIYPVYGQDNQYFVGTIPANGTTTVTIPVVVNSKFAGEFVDLSLDLIYEIGGKQLTNKCSMILPAQIYKAVIVNDVEVSNHATVNGKSLLGVSYYNNSTEDIDDAVLMVSGNISDTTKRIELEPIAAGKFYTNDKDIIFTESGEQTISILLSYTNENGELVESDLGTYTVIVSDEDYSTSLIGKENTQLKMVGRIVSLVAFLAIVVVSVVYVKKR